LARSVRKQASAPTTTNRSTKAQRYFVETNVRFQNNFTGIYQNDERSPTTGSRQTDVLLGGGINIGLLGQIRAGWQESWWQGQDRDRLRRSAGGFEATMAAGLPRSTSIRPIASISRPAAGRSATRISTRRPKTTANSMPGERLHGASATGFSPAAVVSGIAGRQTADLRSRQPRRHAQHDRLCRRPVEGRRHELRQPPCREDHRPPAAGPARRHAPGCRPSKRPRSAGRLPKPS
jgi:hypothetical protein